MANGPTGASIRVAGADVEAYDRDGVVCLRGVFDACWIELVARGIERNLANPGKYFKDNSPVGSAGRYLTDFWSWFHIPEFQEYAFDSPAAELAGRLMQAEGVILLEDNWFLKEPGTTTRTPWHQDEPYYDVAGTFCSVWMPLDPVTRDNGIEFVRGSHRWGRLFVPANFSDQRPLGAALEIKGERYDIMPDVQADRGAYEIVSWELEPGDCIVFSARTVHGAPGNQGARHTSRRMSTRWAKRDAVYHRKDCPWSDLVGGHGLEDGDLLEGVVFPPVWRRPRPG